jgi:hypothetical protein
LISTQTEEDEFKPELKLEERTGLNEKLPQSFDPANTSTDLDA